MLMDKHVFLKITAVIMLLTVVTTVMKLMAVCVFQSLSLNVPVEVVSMVLGHVMVNQIVLMTVMKSTVLNVLKELTNVPMATVFLKNGGVIILMTVKITVMKLMGVSAIQA